ncbi:MAG TPA: hypothetical protein DCL60_10790, partial [Armatimonadetes bacterium]|nr:hypothetical protein [Armatimonadota bacterium]
EVTFIGRGEGNFEGTPFDRDGRALIGAGTANPGNVFQNVTGFTDFQLGVKGKVSDTLSATALIDAGNYLPFALNGVSASTANVDRFTLWNAYADA